MFFKVRQKDFMKKKTGIRIVRLILLAVIVVCLLLLVREHYLSGQHKLQQDSLRAKKLEETVKEREWRHSLGILFSHCPPVLIM